MDLNLDLNHQDFLGRTALHYACYHSLSKAVEALLLRADATVLDHENATILHSWSLGHDKVYLSGHPGEEHWIRTLMLILDNYKSVGLDIQHKDSQGETALDYLQQRRRRKWLFQLLKDEYLKIE